MTRQEFAVIASALKTYYPREERLLATDKTVASWFAIFRDVPYKDCAVALKRWVSEKQFSPSLAELLALSREVEAETVDPWDEKEAWQRTAYAANRFGADRQADAMTYMDYASRKAVLEIGYAAICQNPMSFRENFRELYTQFANQRKYDSIRERKKRQELAE